MFDNLRQSCDVVGIGQFDVFGFDLADGIGGLGELGEKRAPEVGQALAIVIIPGSETRRDKVAREKSSMNVGKGEAGHKLAIERQRVFRSLLPEAAPFHFAAENGIVLVEVMLQL